LASTRPHQLEGNVALMTFNPPFVLDAALNAALTLPLACRIPFKSAADLLLPNSWPIRYRSTFTGNRFPRAATIPILILRSLRSSS